MEKTGPDNLTGIVSEIIHMSRLAALMMGFGFLFVGFALATLLYVDAVSVAVYPLLAALACVLFGRLVQSKEEVKRKELEKTAGEL